MIVPFFALFYFLNDAISVKRNRFRSYCKMKRSDLSMKDEHSYEHRSELISLRSNLLDWADSIVFALIVVMIFNLGFRIVNVNGESMLPTLHTNDRLIVSSVNYQPQYGDIVVSVQENALEKAIIKRVIAVGGQTVDIDTEKGIVYVDGKALEEPYVYDFTYVIPYHITT